MMIGPERFAASLARLSPLEVFDFYDGPRFYSVKDAVGQLYLVYWVDEFPAGSAWLYVRVSLDRYASLKQGVIPIATALSQPEDEVAYVIHITPDGPEVEEIEARKIDPEWLPPPAEALSLPSSPLPAKTSTASESALGARRQVLDVAFQKSSNRYEIGAGKLGRLLEAIQNTVYALACAPDRDVRRVPEDVKFGNEMMVTGVFASSFGVRLQSKGTDLFDGGDSARALQTFTELFELLSRPDELTENLHRLNILGRSRFKHLLRVLVDSEVSIGAEWADPSGAMRSSRATLPEVAVALGRLEATESATTRQVDRTGRLVGVDVQSNFFALAVDGAEVVRGTLGPAVVQRKFEVPSHIVATLEETSVVDPLTDREKWTYVLLAASEPEA